MLPPEPARASADLGPPANYLDLYGLSRPPFGGSSDSAGFILFNSQRRAFEAVIDHLVNGSGVVRLLGEEGIGKSEILKAAASAAGGSDVRTIMVSRPPGGRITLRELTLMLGSQSEADESSIDNMVTSFQQPPRKALLVDDIDLMPNDCVSLLLNLAQLKPKENAKVTIILSSSEDPASDPMRQNLAQLLSLSKDTIRISRLGPAEVRQYIERSLWIAGGTTRRLIATDAMKLLTDRSRGVPGMVDRLMEAVLTAGFARGDSMITAKTVAAAMGPEAHRPRRRASDISNLTGRALPIVAMGLLLTGASVFLYKASRGPVQTVSSSAPAKPVVKPVSKAPPVVGTPKEDVQPVKPVEAVPPELIAALMKRGDQLLELGDIAAARLLFQRAAEADDAAAATALGKTYDPNVAAAGSARDPGRAAEWYRKAAALGDVKAADLLRRLGVR